MAGVKKLPASATFPEVALLLCWLALLLCWQAGQDKLGSSTHSPHLMCARTCARICARILTSRDVIFLDAHCHNNGQCASGQDKLGSSTHLPHLSSQVDISHT